ncbi:MULTISPECIES: DUF3352 domain-containing protein [Pseudanabaena]|uniref:DUF3352 domain-containing protein n=2 Tax=Pseudanabaena TaxID=1152 RepID=L8N0N9_9CYAN|nr:MULTISPECIES: DUF3352 domain-containing protein [Pseudanabaena]ELS33281.1 hypothetical protein Pse7429DRAFT_1717 [Pseudanabaena biceps PCC 7429]MDG3494501.1 DUF3352 domain-containing protein [Pseudanabaena catenata USMAC16]
MKIKSVFVGIAVVGVLLLVLSFSTVAKVLGANPRDVLLGVKTQPQAVNFLPQRSPLFWSFLINPERLELFSQLAVKPSERREVRQAVADLKQKLQQNWLIDYDRDIQPWLDQEITLALTDTDLDRQPNNGLQSGYLLAFAAKDSNLAKASIDAFWQRLAVNGSDLGFEQYQGVSILSTSFAEDRPAIAGTILGKFVLFANDSRVLREVIAAWRSPDLALASLDTYRARQAPILDKNNGKVAVAYVNLAELGEDLPKESLLMDLRFDKAGIRAKTSLTLANQSTETSTEISTDQSTDQSTEPKISQKILGNMASVIPSGSSVVIGNNLGQTVASLKKTLAPEWQNLLAKAIAPIPLESRALTWAQGDYAIALIPQPHSHPDWLIVAKVEDAEIAKTAIASLDDLARNKLTVGEISLEQQPVTVWTKLIASDNSANDEVSGKAIALHTQTKDYLYLSNSLKILESALTIKNSASIAASKDFKKIVSGLPKDISAYGYINNNFDFSWLQTSISDLKFWSKIPQKIGNNPPFKIIKHLESGTFTNTFTSESSSTDIFNGEIELFLK